jgi:ubiquinone/menaquinone biosynthesis C-methylase UbiE
MEFLNLYDDLNYAEAYAKLEFPGTYYLAYRDLPEIISKHVKGLNAIDFGCGTGRSTRFLKKLGFNSTGIDISEDMIKRAREFDTKGNYHLIEDGDFSQLKDNDYDVILSAFTFDNIPTMEKKVKIFKGLRSLLKSEGKIINLVSSPEIYMNEWASFSTKDFPENKNAKNGDKVKIIVTDLDYKKPMEDIIWTDEYYQMVFKQSGLELVKTYKPLAKVDEPYNWINETTIPPWVIYVLKKVQENHFS